jgi:hypothetical protein
MRPKEPVFLKPIERAKMRRLFSAPNNLDLLLTGICSWIPDLPEATDLSREQVARAGRALAGAVLAKLARHYPKTALRGDSVLLKTHPDRSGNLVNQALNRLRDLWTKDLCEHPTDKAGRRLARLAPSLSQLPSVRGSHHLSETDRLLSILADYYDALGKLPKRKRGPFSSQQIEAVFGRKLSREELDALRGKRPSEIALEYARRADGDRPEVGVDHARRLLRQARTLARAVASSRRVRRRKVRSMTP